MILAVSHTRLCVYQGVCGLTSHTILIVTVREGSTDHR